MTHALNKLINSESVIPTLVCCVILVKKFLIHRSKAAPKARQMMSLRTWCLANFPLCLLADHGVKTLLLLVWPWYSIPGEWKNYAMQYKKYKNQAEMSLAPPPPPSQDCDVVGWYCTDAGIQTVDDDCRCRCLVVRVWWQEFCRQWRTTSRVEQFKWRHGGDFQKTAEDISI